MTPDSSSADSVRSTYEDELQEAKDSSAGNQPHALLEVRGTTRYIVVMDLIRLDIE